MTRHRSSPAGSRPDTPIGDHRTNGWSSEYERIFLLNARMHHDPFALPPRAGQVRKPFWL